MDLYILTKNDVPHCATFNEREALGMFDSTVRSGCYRQASVYVISAPEKNGRVLLEAYQND